MSSFGTVIVCVASVCSEGSVVSLSDDTHSPTHWNWYES